MKRKIVLHGYLKKLYAGLIEVEADSVAEAVRSLAFIPELQREDGQPHTVRIKGITSDIALYSKSSMADIHIYPRIGGAGGRGGILQVLLGIVLVAVSIAFPVILGFSTSSLFMTGALMVLGGVLQMLLPAPEKTEAGQSSKYLGASVNTVQIGTRQAIIAGTRRWGGHYLSFDVDAKELAPKQGETIVDTGANYFVHDATVLSTPLAPVNPVYASSVTGPSTFPISSWSP